MKPLPQAILLIEADPYDIELTLREFETHDLAERIVVRRDGAEAFKFLFAEGAAASPRALPQAILIGWKLPKLDGLDVLRRLKGEARTRGIPTFLLLSSELDVAHLATEQLQPEGYLIKPVCFQEFVKQFGPAMVRQSQASQITFGVNRN